MRLILLACSACVLSSIAHAQVTSPAHVFMISLCIDAGMGTPPQCNCWAHTAIGMLRPEDLQAVMQGYETPRWRYAVWQANAKCLPQRPRPLGADVARPARSNENSED
jgi:hypothetical protein